MPARDAIEISFRRLLEKEEYEKISVASICRDAHISRKTFYANFQDKEDIILKEFERDIVQPILDLNRMLTLKAADNMKSFYHEYIYQQVLKDKEYYRRIVRPSYGAGDVFLRVVTKALYDLNLTILDKPEPKKTAWQKDYAAYFFASGQALLVQQWVIDGTPFTVEQMARFYEAFEDPFWRGMLMELQENGHTL